MKLRMRRLSWASERIRTTQDVHAPRPDSVAYDEEERQAKGKCIERASSDNHRSRGTVRKSGGSA